MHDSRISWCANRKPLGQPRRRVTQDVQRNRSHARPPETQNPENIVADSQPPQGSPSKLTTGFGTAALALALAACSPTGDFGRPAADLAPLGSTIAADSVRPWWHTDSRPNLTEDERELRNRAWHFLPKPGRRSFAATNAGHAFEVSAYYDALIARRPPDAARAKLQEDVADDARLAAAFFAVADRVWETDSKRNLALDGRTEASRDAAGALRERLVENAELIGAVKVAARQRLAGFEYAAARLDIEAPSPAADRTSAALGSLRRVLARTPPPPEPPPTVIGADD